MQRTLEPYIREDLEERIAFVTGPRQCGKTTLSRQLFTRMDYLNYDLAEHRLQLIEKNWNRDVDLVIFDELHKKKEWKTWLKGIWDTERPRPRMLVTGSARLDTFRRVGDSLAGRFFQYRLHPFDVKEVAGEIPPAEALERILRFGGFPEPFLKADSRFSKRWQRSHIDVILRQDAVDLSNIRDIRALETLVMLLRRRVGSPVSFANLARDLERDPKTVRLWIELLENLYVVFRVSPFHMNIARSLLMESKYYFFDTALVQGDDGARLENAVAASLQKEVDFVSDIDGDDIRLHYLRTRDGQEIDFAVARDNRVFLALEVKVADDTPSVHFSYFSKFLAGAARVQLVGRLRQEKTRGDGVQVRDAAQWLARMNFRSTDEKAFAVKKNSFT